MGDHDHHAMGHGDHMNHGNHMNHGMDHAATTESGTEHPHKVIGDHSHYVYSTGGHGDGALQAGVDEVLLFTGAVTSSPGSLFLACLILMVAAFALEYLRLLVWLLESRYTKCSGGRRDEMDGLTSCSGANKTYGTKQDTEMLPVNGANGDNSTSTDSATSFRSYWWLVLGLLHWIVYIAGTCLMLITMTFNIFIIMAIALGAALGKLATMYTRPRISK